jgi:hypothetical protein
VPLGSSWAAPEREGRLGLELAYPPSRVRLFAEWAVATALTATIAVGFAGTVLFVRRDIVK